MSTHRDAHAATLPSLRAERADIANWLADQWPKAAIGFGIVVTVVWTGLLVWCVGRVLGLF